MTITEHPSTTTEETAAIRIDRIDAATVMVPIVGTSPLLVHRFSEKAKQQMLDNMQGRKSPKSSKDPNAEYEAAFYKFVDGGYGFPVTAFKQATIGGARFYGRDVTMVALRQSMFFTGETGMDGQSLVRIDGSPHLREDVVRVGRGGTDLRYRPQFNEWSTTLTITYVKSMLTLDSLVSLIDAGGMGVGVGEWRPERGGDLGMFTVDLSKEITERIAQ
jgi:hypothetical protein